MKKIINLLVLLFIAVVIVGCGEVKDDVKEVSYLEELEIIGFKLKPAFDREITEYTLNLDPSIKKIKVVAKGSNRVRVVGTGERDISDLNEVVILVDEKVIKIRLIREVKDLVKYSIASGTYSYGRRVELNKDRVDGEIVYTLDGSEPNSTSTKYVEPLKLEEDIIIKTAIVVEGFIGPIEEEGYTVDQNYAYVESGSIEAIILDRNISIEEDFSIGRYEVTQGEFEKVMGFNPSNFRDSDGKSLENNPIEGMTRFDALVYCNRLSELEGLQPYYVITNIKRVIDNVATIAEFNLPDGECIVEAKVEINKEANGYRLPSEEQWIFAMCGGINSKGYQYSGSNVIDEVAWYKSNSSRKTHEVGKKQANELGIYDMNGNVWEWTNTDWGEPYYCFAGGCWAYEITRILNYNISSIRTEDIGFRVVKPN